MTATLGTALVSEATIHVERYGIPTARIATIDDPSLPIGSSQALAVGTLSMVGFIATDGSFGGDTRAHWMGGIGGLDANDNGVSAWSLTLPARPYHDDNGIMLSVVLGDLERDAAIAAGASSIGVTLEVPDMRLDVAGAWIRPAAMGRDLLDALTVAAGLARGTWWVANDGSTHLGPRPSSQVALSNLTVDPYDAAIKRAMVRVADDNLAPLVPGATLTAPGLPAPLTIALTIVRVASEDISVELWGEASHAELFARTIEHVMAPTVAYLAPQAYGVTGVASDGRVQVAAPQGSTWPDAPLLGHAPGLPGASFMMAPGASVLVSCVGGSPGAPVCVAYPQGTLPMTVTLDASGSVTLGGMATSVNVGGAGAAALALAAPLIAWANGVNAALAAAGHPAPTLGIAGTTIAKGV